MSDLDLGLLEAKAQSLNGMVDLALAEFANHAARWRQQIDEVAHNLHGAATAPSTFVQLPSLEALTRSVERIEALPNQFSENGLANQAAQLSETLESFQDLDEEYAELCEEVETGIAATAGAIDALNQLLTSNFAETIEQTGNEINNLIEERVTSVVENLLTETREAVTDALSDANEKAEEIASQLDEAASSAFESLLELISEKVQETLTDGVADIASEAVAESLQNVAASAIVSQLSAQITAAMSAQLPQLIVAKKSVGTVRRLLEIMRSGGL